jgi:hypothetical protein
MAGETTVLNTRECSWSQISINILGRKLVGLRGFELKKTIEKEHLYGAGDSPIDIQSGNKKTEGSLKLLKFEVDILNDAALLAGYSDIIEVPHELIAITVLFKKGSGAVPMRTLTATGVAFTELSVAVEQGAKMTEVTLPFLAMGHTVS